MAVIDTIKRVCTVIGLEVPTAVYGSTEREHVELADLANDTSRYIAEDHDWELLKIVQTMLGDGVKVDFDFPADYDRMLKKAQIWSTQYETAMEHIIDSDTWLGMEIREFDWIINAWTIFGGQIHIKPALDTDEEAKYFYISDLIVSPETGDDKTEFDNDTDTFRLDDELLRLGMIWKWRANKRFPYAEDLASYEQRKELVTMRDKGSRMLVQPSRRVPYGARTSYPRSIVP